MSADKKALEQRCLEAFNRLSTEDKMYFCGRMLQRYEDSCKRHETTCCKMIDITQRKAALK